MVHVEEARSPRLGLTRGKVGVIELGALRGRDKLHFETTVVEGGVLVRKTAGQGKLF